MGARRGLLLATLTQSARFPLLLGHVACCLDLGDAGAFCCKDRIFSAAEHLPVQFDLLLIRDVRQVHNNLVAEQLVNFLE